MTALIAQALLVFARPIAAQELPPSLREAALPAATRSMLQQRTAALRGMNLMQRQALQRRLADWHELPEAARRERRERWQAWQALPAGERARLRAAAARFAALPMQQQLELRRRYAALDEDPQRGWLLGPDLGADWERLAPLLMQVPESQRAPLLSVLRALGPRERADLGVLAQRTPPQERDALRRELIAQPAASRGVWLAVRVRR